jgi:hypothetical protein
MVLEGGLPSLRSGDAKWLALFFLEGLGSPGALPSLRSGDAEWRVLFF